MANIGGKVLTKFRDKFQKLDKETLQWFPGHMRKGLRQMQQLLKNVDCVIEVHDARVPISGRFTDFKLTVSGLKPHIFVLNKKDLANQKYNKTVVEYLKEDGIPNVLFTNFKDQQCPGMKKILPLATQLIKDSNRYNRETERDFSIMVIGVPNVGKSSLINRLRNKHLKKSNATRVGGVAGITRSVLTRIKISEDPPVYLLDTPGILTPTVKNLESGLKLAAVGCLQDHLVGQQIIADYLLFYLNKRQMFSYVDVLNLSEPSDDILLVLTQIAAKLGKVNKLKNFDGQYIVRPNFVAAADHFLKVFRSGELGRMCLDDDLLEMMRESRLKQAQSSE